MNIMKAGTEHKEKISYEDFLVQYEGRWAEWVDGEVAVIPSATARHQDVLGFLLCTLGVYIESHNLGEILPAPFQIKLGPGLPSREPDLLYIASPHLGRLKDMYLDGPADMVIEIVSQESISRDRGEKFVEYEAAGVSEYWLIDPTREQADFYRLDTDGHYHRILPDDQGIYRSEVVKGFWLKVSWLWQEPMPPVWRV